MLIARLVLVLAAAAALQASAAVWNCTAKAVYVLAGDGTLVPERLGRPAWKPADRIMYDEASGLVRFVPDGPGKAALRLQFEAWQAGSSQNSAIALYRLQGPAASPLMTLRIVAYASGEAKPFTFADEDGTTVTGTCIAAANR